MGQNFAASAAFNAMTAPIISAFCCRTSVRRRSMYSWMFFFCAPALGDALVCAPALLACVFSWDDAAGTKHSVAKTRIQAAVCFFISFLRGKYWVKLRVTHRVLFLAVS